MAVKKEKKPKFSKEEGFLSIGRGCFSAECFRKPSSKRDATGVNV